jgi:hypothetical protein
MKPTSIQVTEYSINTGIGKEWKMITLKNQTIYKCEYCGKRLLSKNGAKLHEENYCWASPIPKQKEREKQENCNHDDIKTSYRYIPGEAVMEPDYNYCVECGKVM